MNRKRITVLVIGIVGLAFLTTAIGFARFTEQEAFEVTGYTEVEKTYYNVDTLNIWNDGKTLRLAYGDETTDDGGDYTIISSTGLGWEDIDLRIESLTIKLKGNTASDTATVRVTVYKY